MLYEQAIGSNTRSFSRGEEPGGGGGGEQCRNDTATPRLAVEQRQRMATQYPECDADTNKRGPWAQDKELHWLEVTERSMTRA